MLTYYRFSENLKLIEHTKDKNYLFTNHFNSYAMISISKNLNFFSWYRWLYRIQKFCKLHLYIMIVGYFESNHIFLLILVTEKFNCLIKFDLVLYRLQKIFLNVCKLNCTRLHLPKI